MIFELNKYKEYKSNNPKYPYTTILVLRSSIGWHNGHFDAYNTRERYVHLLFQTFVSLVISITMNKSPAYGGQRSSVNFIKSIKGHNLVKKPGRVMALGQIVALVMVNK